MTPCAYAGLWYTKYVVADKKRVLCFIHKTLPNNNLIAIECEAPVWCTRLVLLRLAVSTKREFCV